MSGGRGAGLREGGLARGSYGAMEELPPYRRGFAG